MKNAVERVINPKSPGFYSRLFLVPQKKRRQLETGYRSVWPKQIHHSSKVQDGDLPVHQECYPSERLGSVIGSNRRLLSRNDSPVLEEIPSLHSEWKSTPVPGSSIRDFVSSKDLHQDHGSSRGLFAHARPPTTPVLRRLAATQRESVQSSKRLASHMADSHKPGAYSEYSEIGINSHERVHIRGNDVPHRVRFCTSPVKKSRITSRNDSYLFDQNISISSLDAITHGVSKCSSRSCYTWPTSHETTTVSIPRSVASLHRSSRSRDSYVRHLQVPPELVAEHGCLCERYSLAYPHSRPLSFTDSSLVGWGAHLEPLGLTAQGLWSVNEKCLHINNLELKAVSLALLRFATIVTGKTVQLATDNTTVVSYIRRQGGLIPFLCFGKLGNFSIGASVCQYNYWPNTFQGDSMF